MTASSYRIPGKIENLPPVQRAAVVDAILAGRALRDVAKIAGCSPMAVSRFRDNVVLPALSRQPSGQGIPKAEVLLDNGTPTPISNPAHTLQTRQEQTKEVLRTSPVRERVEKLWGRTDRLLDRVEADDKLMGLASGLLNQAHKNAELTGKLTGELQDARGGGGPSVAVQIVYHGAIAPEVTIGADGVIDAPGVKIGIRSNG